MAQRTYVPQLRIVTYLLKRYVNRNQVKLQANLDPAVYALLLTLLDAADDLLIALGEPDINP
jgi:hypothetical protein